MTNFSAVCSVTDALYTRWTAALATALPHVRVVDGILVGDKARKIVLQVGADDADAKQVSLGSSRIEWAGLGNLARDESVTINNVLTAWNGGTDPKVVRDEADAVLAVCQQNLYSDATADGAWMAHIASTDWRQAQTEAGAATVCTFTVVAFVRLSV